MMRMVFLFLVFWMAVVLGLHVWRQLTGKEKWKTIKTVIYGLLTAAITFVILSVFVILF